MENMVDYVSIGRRIRAKRNAKNWSQEQLAEAAFMTKSNVSHIENGQYKLSLPSIINIANALEVSLDELVCDSLCTAAPIYEGEIHALLQAQDAKTMRYLSELLKTALKNLSLLK